MTDYQNPQVPEDVKNEDQFGVAVTVNDQTDEEMHGIVPAEDFDLGNWPRIRLKRLELVNFGKYEDAVIEFTNDGNPLKMACLLGPNGSGKCFAKGTQVLMFDGSIKSVEDVGVGDLVMGNDSAPREVLATHNGVDEMFSVVPSKGDPYVVNGEHILVLKITGSNTRREYKSFEDSQGLIKISAKDFVKQSRSFKHLMVGLKSGVEFDSRTLKIEPYLLGTWLGDGTSASPSITTADQPIAQCWGDEAAKRNLRLHVLTEKRKSKAKRYSLSGKKGVPNSLTQDLRSYKLINNKHIPTDYKINSRENRLQLLAGLLDTDGSYSLGGFDYISVSKRLADDVAYLVHSLGFSACIKQCQKRCQTGAVGTYYRMNINGPCDEIPTRLPHKQSRKRTINKNCLQGGIKVVPCGIGEYYGFQTDGNNLFLLGDFTVVHNSTILDAVTMLCSNFSEYSPQRFSEMMLKRVRNWMHLKGDDRIRNASFSVKGIFEADYPVYAPPYIPETEAKETGLVRKEYTVEFTRHKFRSRHPEFIEQRLVRYCFAARFDQELQQFQMRRDRWPLFQELFSAVTGFPIEEDVDLFHDTSDTRMRRIYEEYVLQFTIRKPKEIIRQNMCSAGEKKIAKCFSTVLNARIEPSIILVDNVLMHIEVGRHLSVMNCLQRCFPNSQLVVACHSVSVSKSLPNREGLFDMRWLEIPGTMWREPWRLRLLDDVNECLERLTASCDQNQEKSSFISEGASIVRKLETEHDANKIMLDSVQWLSRFPSFIVSDLFATPAPKMRWHDNRQLE
jgi:hypothetical protein